MDYECKTNEMNNFVKTKSEETKFEETKFEETKSDKILNKPKNNKFILVNKQK